MVIATAARRARGPDELTAPDYVVLGMVRLGARSGYEIKQTVAQTIRFFWTISQAQIYPSLERLERNGLLVGRAEPQGRRKRRVYDTTAAGQTAMRRWLVCDESMPLELRDLGLLKLFFAGALERDDACALLAAVKERSERGVAALRAIEPAGRRVEAEGDPHPLLTLQIGIALHEAMLKVCEDFERLGARSSR